MGEQNPLSVTIATNASGVQSQLKVDNDGNLRVASSGEAVSVAQNVGTIAATGTFQAALAVNANRKAGGGIVNLGSHQMSVLFSANTGTSTAAAVPVVAGTTLLAAGTLSFSSFFPQEVYQGAISIEGTSGDTYVTVENS
jgi:hypothetical protein